jgi:peptide/nickel transport system permease protein
MKIMRRGLGLQTSIGAGIFSLIFLVAIFAPLLSPHDPFALGTPFQAPSSEHLLGTNDIGQDILSELIYGTRVSLIIGIVSALAVTAVGTTLGMLAGYFGGVLDKMIVQTTNVGMALPTLPLVIILVAFMKASIWNIIIAICITSWTGTTRIVRSRVKQIREFPFIKIEQTIGASYFYILFRHILPNIGEIVFIRGVLAVADAMLTEASLSFLGLGVINQKSWGGILHYAFFRNGIINGYYWWYMPPIVCISMSVLSFMLLGGDGRYSARNETRKTHAANP